jgi:hypothetical protein
MIYKVASTLDEVISAWGLVYKQYLQASFIRPNEISVFTFPEYLSNNSAVVVGEKRGQVVCTASAVLDSPQGLPLDAYYQKELNQLRNEGRKLIEIGLLADTRGSGNVNEIMDLISAISRFGGFSGHHDYVIGVNPKRINLFSRVFGVKLYGEPKDYDALKSAPVVLMHVRTGDLEVNIRRAIARICNVPLNLNFSQRFRFNPNNVIPSVEFGGTIDSFVKMIWNRDDLKAA